MTLDDVVIYLPDITQYNHGLAIISESVPGWEAFGKRWGRVKTFPFLCILTLSITRPCWDCSRTLRSILPLLTKELPCVPQYLYSLLATETSADDCRRVSVGVSVQQYSVQYKGYNLIVVTTVEASETRGTTVLVYCLINSNLYTGTVQGW